MSAMLEGVRVVELVERADADAAAAFCARILADLGADVVKVEPPGGDPLRDMPPFLAGVAGPDRSLTWIAFNANKRGVVIDPTGSDGMRRLRALVERSDVVVTADATRAAELQRWNEQIIVSVVTPYGASGPLAGAPAPHLEVPPASGSLWVPGGAGPAPPGAA